MRRKIRIVPPEAQVYGHRSEKEEVAKYLKMIPGEPEPNLGRVYEIKEQLRNGTYEITNEMIEECAGHIAARFMRGENL